MLHEVVMNDCCVFVCYQPMRIPRRPRSGAHGKCYRTDDSEVTALSISLVPVESVCVCWMAARR